MSNYIFETRNYRENIIIFRNFLLILIPIRLSKVSDFSSEKEKRSLVLRVLNEASLSSLSISHQKAFRPTMTLLSRFDKTTDDAAIEVSKYIIKYETEVLDQINVNGLIVLVSMNLLIHEKAPIVNLAIKW